GARAAGEIRKGSQALEEGKASREARSSSKRVREAAVEQGVRRKAQAPGLTRYRQSTRRRRMPRASTYHGGSQLWPAPGRAVATGGVAVAATGGAAVAGVAAGAGAGAPARHTGRTRRMPRASR